MFMTMLAGLLTGLIVSIPIGPVAAQAAHRWMDGKNRDVYGMAVGVYIGDIVVAAVVMTLLYHHIVELSGPVMIGGVAVMFIMAAIIKRHLTWIEGVKGSFSTFVLMGWFITIIQAGNYGTYLMFYGWGVQGVLGVPMVAEMTWEHILAMVVMNAVGLLIGWILYFAYISYLKRTRGVSLKPLLSFLTPTLVAAAGIFTLVHYML